MSSKSRAHLFISLVYTCVAILFFTSLFLHYFATSAFSLNLALGVLSGVAFLAFLTALDKVIDKCNLQSLGVGILGLFLGYMLSQGILLTVDGVFQPETAAIQVLPLRFALFLCCSYLGLKITLQSIDQLTAYFPFLDFKEKSTQKKDILVDLSILADPRIIDLASTGLLDHHLIIPRFAVHELYTQAEVGDEMTKAKARKCLEMIKKLETLPHLDLRYTDHDIVEVKEPMTKLIHLARLMDTQIITSDMNRVQQSSIEGVRIINIHMLSQALKPITQSGETLSIKIQRYGKEPRQGVGYLEDGTMVVVNGGAEFIGETIKAYVLSVKHTSSGRMIFCNAADEANLMGYSESQLVGVAESESHKSFLAL